MGNDNLSAPSPVMYARIGIAICRLSDENLPLSTKKVRAIRFLLSYLTDYSYDWCEAPASVIEEGCGVSAVTAFEVLQSLSATGVIIVDPNSGRGRSPLRVKLAPDLV